MGTLSDSKIRQLVKRNLLVISPFEDSAVTSNGYDLLLEDFELSPKKHSLIKSNETVKIPKNLIAIPFLRTTYAFKGLILSPGIIDAGYSGKLIFSLFNSSDKKITLEKEKI